jgi:hypothetical protein
MEIVVEYQVVDSFGVFRLCLAGYCCFFLLNGASDWKFNAGFG